MMDGATFAVWHRTETHRVRGHLVTRGCCLSASGKWWPIASVGVAEGAPMEVVAFSERDLQDTPAQALECADRLAMHWIRIRETIKAPGVDRVGGRPRQRPSWPGLAWLARCTRECGHAWSRRA